ncbi:MAG: metallophosphoesterase, partial [Lachnospiraceae bacterium]|nr:metallophosphoesterase [Lachnospiraceae bacterium]
MNIAVLSDIHGNHIALETCMGYLEKQDIDAYCFLGDYVGEFPGIRQVMDTLYDLQKKKPCYIIKGNKEDYQLFGLGEGHPEWDAYPSTVGMIRYGCQQLTEEDMSFLMSLPITDCIHIDGMEDIRICHGSPREVREDIRAGKGVNKEILAEVKEKYI